MEKTLNAGLFPSHKTSSGGTENVDIQNKLYSWFQENKIVDKLRAYSREQMISALKNEPLLNTGNRNVSSPKVQAINLLVADFLLNQQNLFTLSVFITEVPLLGNLHEFSSYVNRSTDSIKNKTVTKHNFHLNDIQDILETLGVQKNSDFAELTCQYYLHDADNGARSLLACLFNAIMTLRNNFRCDDNQNNKDYSNKSPKIKNDTYEYRLNNWLISVEDILSSFNLNEEQRQTLKNVLKNYHQSCSTQETAVYKERLKKLENLNKEMEKKVDEVEKILTKHFHSRETNFFFQKEQIENESLQLRLEQQRLCQLINDYEEKEKSIQEKLKKSEEEHNKKLLSIESQKYELKIKEIEILKLEKILKENFTMHHNNENRTIESNQVKRLQEQNIELAKQLQEIKLKINELEKYKEIKQVSIKEKDNSHQIIESNMDVEMVRKLQRENGELREFIKIQSQNIEELSNKATNLAKQIEQSHKVPPSTTIDYRTRNVKKKLNFVDEPSKRNCCTNQNISSTTTDYSTTVLESDIQTEDDVILEARSRLKTLEMNTAKAERNLLHFQTNRMHRNNNHNVNQVSRRSYKDIRSNFSDDSDFGTLKSNSNRINLKELANKIGYHRSIRRSANPSPSKYDSSPEVLQNTRVQGSTNANFISPINNVYRKSSINRNCSRVESPITRVNCQTEFPINRSNVSTQLSNDNQSLTDSAIINRCLPSTNIPELNNSKCQTQAKTNSAGEISCKINSLEKIDSQKNSDENNYTRCDKKINTDGSKLFNEIEISDSQTIQITTARQNSYKEADTSSYKRENESDHSITIGSNKTDKSSDFWA